MAYGTKIEWCDATWNPVTGCTKVSPGCTNCYAETITNRFKRHPFEEVQFHPDRLNQPLQWKKPRRIFVCSMGDLFHGDVPWEFIGRVFNVMEACPQHTFQVLTKRPGLMDHFANKLWCSRPWHKWPDNVWAGTSVESAKYLPRLDVLARVPAKVRFLSAEPLLGPLNLLPWLSVGIEWDGDLAHDSTIVRERRLDWVIGGGESGAGARPAHPDWFRGIRNQCQAAGVPYFHKQNGQWLWHPHYKSATPVPGKTPDWRNPERINVWPDGSWSERGTSKKAAGALLDGREWREFPL